MTLQEQTPFVFIRMRGLQQPNQSPVRTNKKDWWLSVHRSLRQKGYKLHHPNSASHTELYNERTGATRTIYGPCGKLPR